MKCLFCLLMWNPNHICPQLHPPHSIHGCEWSKAKDNLESWRERGEHMTKRGVVVGKMGDITDSLQHPPLVWVCCVCVRECEKSLLLLVFSHPPWRGVCFNFRVLRRHCGPVYRPGAKRWAFVINLCDTRCCHWSHSRRHCSVLCLCSLAKEETRGRPSLNHSRSFLLLLDSSSAD